MASDLGRALGGEHHNPPLYYTLLHFWIRCFGTSEAALRSLSIIPGVLSVWLVYLLAKKLFAVGIALGAALYQAISPFQIYYSQEARTFSFLVFFLLLAALALWNALETAPGRRRFLYFAVYALAGALSLYAHFIAVFFLAGLGVFVLLRRRKQLVPFAVSSAVALALFLPWLSTLLRAAAGGGQHRRYLLLKLPQAYFSFLFGDTLIPLDAEAAAHIRETLLQFAPFLLGAIVSVALLLPFIWRAWKRWGDRLEYAIIAASVPVLLAFLVSFKVMFFDERYLIPAAPFLYMLVAAAVAELLWWRREGRPTWQNWAGLAAVAVYAVLLLVSLQHYFFAPRFGKEQWRDAVAFIESQESGKAVLVFDPDYVHWCYDYYQRRGFPYLQVPEDMVNAADLSPAAVRSQVAGYDSIWLIRSHTESKVVLESLQAQFQQDAYRDFPKGDGIEVARFRAR